MGHIFGADRSQLLLLPDAVDDYVGPDNPVRFIDAFVDSLDLKEAGFQRVRPNDKGRPGSDPADLLKLYIYGYLTRVRSSRRLEAETHRNLEVIWLLRQLRPDFKTIADFRRDNRSAFRQVFREFVRLCRELDLYGRELIAVDGTRIKAVNNRDRNFTRATLKRDLQRIDDQLERYLEQMNEADANAASGGGNSVADSAKPNAQVSWSTDRQSARAKIWGCRGQPVSLIIRRHAPVRADGVTPFSTELEFDLGRRGFSG